MAQPATIGMQMFAPNKCALVFPEDTKRFFELTHPKMSEKRVEWIHDFANSVMLKNATGFTASKRKQ